MQEFNFSTFSGWWTIVLHPNCSAPQRSSQLVQTVFGHGAAISKSDRLSSTRTPVARGQKGEGGPRGLSENSKWFKFKFILQYWIQYSNGQYSNIKQSTFNLHIHTTVFSVAVRCLLFTPQTTAIVQTRDCSTACLTKYWNIREYQHGIWISFLSPN
jgi:hypothetical protein